MTTDKGGSHGKFNFQFPFLSFPLCFVPSSTVSHMNTPVCIEYYWILATFISGIQKCFHVLQPNTEHTWYMYVISWATDTLPTPHRKTIALSNKNTKPLHHLSFWKLLSFWHMDLWFLLKIYFLHISLAKYWGYAPNFAPNQVPRFAQSRFGGDQHTSVKLTGDQHTCENLIDIWGDQLTSVKLTDIKFLLTNVQRTLGF